ncbi:hypothetical protein JCM10908_005282 [Rhodotorula pacifica]|uniref:uncharacterized protein n=1 Tax=Rhodotorula pacifica TaxID=1495444 RepID=UPI0031752886
MAQNAFQPSAPGAKVELDPLACPDLADLPDGVPSLSVEDLVPFFRARLLEGIPYTQISPRVVVAVNPYQPIHATSDRALVDWRTEYADLGTEGIRGTLGPHVWATAQKAYYHMSRTGQDQAIVLTGETGAGKTDSAQLIMKALINLAAPSPGKKGSKLVGSIPAAFFILDTFGSASTLSNSNASRFGRYAEFQFNDKGRLTGLKGLEYSLEKSRVANTPSGERNFHIFHYLVSGVAADERQHLRLQGVSAASFRYLARSRASGQSSAQADTIRLGQLKEAFKAVGFPKKAVASIFQVLAAILHLGNLEFAIDRNRNADSAVVKNPHVLTTAAELLGVSAEELEYALTNKSTLVGGEVCAVFLDAEGASANRDDLASSLYGLVFSWIGEFLNEKLCREDFATFISLVDFPGPAHGADRDGLGVEAFCRNLASERLQGYVLDQLYEANKAEYTSEEIALPGLETKHVSNSETVRLLTNMPGGLVHIIDDQSRRRGKTDTTMLQAMIKRWGNHPSFASRNGDEAQGRPGAFVVSHWDSQTTYSTDSFLAQNAAAISPTFVTLLGGADARGGNANMGAQAGSSFSFVRQLFANGAINVESHARSENTLVAASQKAGPRRAPSTRRPKGRSPFGDQTGEGAGDEATLADAPETHHSVVKDVNESINLLLNTLSTSKSWFVLCMRSNDAQLPHQVDAKLLKHQLRALGVADLARRLRGEYSVSLDTKEWWERYGRISVLADEQSSLGSLTYRDKAERVREILGFSDRELGIGKTKIYLSDAAFRYLEDFLRDEDPEEQTYLQELLSRATTAMPASDPYALHNMPETPALGDYNDAYAMTTSTAALPLVGYRQEFDYEDEAGYDLDRKAYLAGEDDYQSNVGRHLPDEEQSLAPSAYTSTRPMFDSRNAPEKSEMSSKQLDDGVGRETVEVIRMSKARKRWVALTWLFTWWIPSPILSWCGGMKRKDVRMAWREKLLINMLIWLLCGAAVFVIAVMGRIICPTQHVYNTEELSDKSYENDQSHMLVSIRGEVFDFSSFAPHHYPGPAVIPTTTIEKLGGRDLTDYFPVQVSALCNGVDGSVSPWVTLEATNVSTAVHQVAQYHDFRAFTSDSRPDWYYETMIYLRYNYRKGFMGFSPGTVKSEVKKHGYNMAIIDGNVYDFTTYIQNNGGGLQVPNGATAPDGTSRLFMSEAIVDLFRQKAGSDITSDFNKLNLAADVVQRQQICMRNLFFIGKVDTRDSAKCQFSQYLLIALSSFMVVIVAAKFLAALQFGRKRKPEDYDKFVICQVPCYTEGEDSLRACLDSLTKLKYDDKRKLLFVICDGMIVGSGNDRPTPQIVLDILGADTSVEPEPLSFHSIGNGDKQHNMAKVYSGLHEAGGHIVPYIVVVKVGKPTERHRPGNRGKRDSQMLLMRFLNRVHFDSPMAPAELEIYHQIKNVIGVNPAFYEYLLMVDADTTVDPFGLNYLVGGFVEDRKIIGLCGETSLVNARASWTTMMQVYEYFISHHLTKAFESLFGTVTCLPGCFSMYRIRTLEHRPVIISDAILAEYGENKVETLHVKNLLSLGEDRYLTTVILKHFPQYKTKFNRFAKAKTIAPDEWKVLMSQRRRWINSTIHNLVELLQIDRMCGFCCFSMRFVILVDLASTLIAPVTVAYIAYLIYMVVGEHKPIPTFALIMIAAIYGCQVVIYVLHRKFEHIGWMLLYILAIPFFSFVLPLVSFWQMDDFSWGSTREIVGEQGKRLLIHDEGKFDPASIPLQKWTDYEEALWQEGDNESIGEIIEASKQQQAQEAASAYGLPYGAASVRGDYDSSPFRSGEFGAAGHVGHGHAPSVAALSQHEMMSLQGYQPPMAGNATMSFANNNKRESTTSFFAANAIRQAAQQQQQQQPRHSYAPSQSHDQLFGYGGGANGGGLPSDDVLAHDVQELLSTADLTQVTKKRVREALEERYGVALPADKKALVNHVIAQVLGLEG